MDLVQGFPDLSHIVVSYTFSLLLQCQWLILVIGRYDGRSGSGTYDRVQEVMDEGEREWRFCIVGENYS